MSPYTFSASFPPSLSLSGNYVTSLGGPERNGKKGNETKKKQYSPSLFFLLLFFFIFCEILILVDG